MKRVMGILTIVLVLLGSTPERAQAGARQCYGTRIDMVDVATFGPLATIAAFRNHIDDPALLKAVLALKGRETWVGYDKGGFDPITTYWNAVIVVHFHVGQATYVNYLWIGNAGDDTKRQVYWFPTMDQYTGTDGKHMGPHPICGWHAIEVDRAVVDNLLALARLP